MKEVIFIFPLLIPDFLLNSCTCSPLNPSTNCHFTCEKCDQFGDPNSCTSCHPDHYKYSVNYGSSVFACKENCSGKSKEMTLRHYKFCLKIISNTTTTSSITSTISYCESMISGISAKIIIFIIITTLLIFSFALFSICACNVFILSKIKAYSSSSRKNNVLNLEAVPLQNPKINPIKLVKTHEMQPELTTTLYTNLRHVNVNDFTIAKGDPLGGGNYSRVYEGTLDGNPVAIKKALKEGRKSIHKEMQIYDTIRHLNIIEAMGVHLAVDNLLFLPLRRFTLSNYFLNYATTIDVKQLIKYCNQLTDALTYLHKNKIIHCDLKTDNILVKDENGEEIEITDFGCSVDLTHDQITAFNGTVTHRAYELLKYPRGPSFVGSEATDVWAYGVTVWQIFSKTEFLPDDFRTSGEIIKNYENGKKLPKPLDMPDRLWRYVFLPCCFDLEASARSSMNEILAKLTKELLSQNE